MVNRAILPARHPDGRIQQSYAVPFSGVLWCVFCPSHPTFFRENRPRMPDAPPPEPEILPDAERRVAADDPSGGALRRRGCRPRGWWWPTAAEEQDVHTSDERLMCSRIPNACQVRADAALGDAPRLRRTHRCVT